MRRLRDRLMLVVGGALVVRRLLISGLAAFAIGLGAAPIASADPPQDYLDTLSNTPGFTVNGFTGPLLLGAGNTICTDLRAGVTPQDSANKMMFYPGATNVTIKAMVATAQQTLCPDTVR